jgi:hypothetical protein
MGQFYKLITFKEINSNTSIWKKLSLISVLIFNVKYVISIIQFIKAYGITIVNSIKLPTKLLLKLTQILKKYPRIYLKLLQTVNYNIFVNIVKNNYSRKDNLKRHKKSCKDKNNYQSDNDIIKLIIFILLK